jgi:signal transduction histidine kinase
VVPCKLLADGDLLFQALANIVDNAVKYTPEGGTISLSMLTKNDYVDIYIADNGIGINEDELSKVFQRFYRVEKSRNMQGNGLGLSLVSAVVGLHKGQVSLHQNNPGLKVSIRLPIYFTE